MAEKNKCEECDKHRKYQEQAFELEVDEDLQQERLDRFWKKYRGLVYAAVVLILGTTAAIQLYQSWRMKVRLAESDKYEDAVIKLYSKQEEAALPILTDLADNGRTGYQYLARFEKAGYAIRQGNIEEGVQELKNVMESGAPKALRQAATLSYVGHQMDNADPDELLAQLEKVKDNTAFIGIVTELQVALNLKKNNPEAAKQALQNALATPNLSEETKTTLQILQQTIEQK